MKVSQEGPLPSADGWYWAARIRRTTSLLIDIPKANSICLAIRGHPHGGLRCFISTTARIKSWSGPFRPCFSRRFGENRSLYFPLNQGAMEIQHSRWLECDRRSQQTFQFDPQRTGSGDQPIPDAEIGRTPARAVHEQKLMFDENGFRNHRT